MTTHFFISHLPSLYYCDCQREVQVPPVGHDNILVGHGWYVHPLADYTLEP